jgi:hypothetical protein
VNSFGRDATESEQAGRVAVNSSLNEFSSVRKPHRRSACPVYEKQNSGAARSYLPPWDLRVFSNRLEKIAKQFRWQSSIQKRGTTPRKCAARRRPLSGHEESTDRCRHRGHGVRHKIDGHFITLGRLILVALRPLVDDGPNLIRRQVLVSDGRGRRILGPNRADEDHGQRNRQFSRGYAPPSLVESSAVA